MPPETIDLKPLVEKIDKTYQFVEETYGDVQKEVRTLGETLEQFKGHVAEVQAEQEKQRMAMPSTAPLSERDGNLLATKGRFVEIGLKKALHFDESHEAFASDDDRAAVKTLKETHDTAALLFHLYYQRTGKNIGLACEKLAKTRTFKRYIEHRERLGFGTAEDLRAKLLSQRVKFYSTGKDDDTEVIEKADEIMSPDASAQQVLDFAVTSSTLIERMRLALRVAAAFESVTLVRSSMNVPAMTNDAMGVWGGGATTKIPARDITSPPAILPPNTMFSVLNFGQVQFDAKHVLTFLALNDDMEEDAVIAFRAKLVDQAAYGAARAVERAILDGDTTATHMDDDVTVAHDLRKAWLGLRKLSKTTMITNSGGQFDVDDLHALRVSLGIYGEVPERLISIMALRDIYRMIGQASGSGDLLRRVDTIGDRATLLTGTLAVAYNIPLVPSEFSRTDLDATGVKLGAGDVTSSVILAHRQRFALGTFGIARIESWRIPPELYTVIQYDARVDFKPWDEHTLTSNEFTGANVPVNVMFNNT